LRPEARGSFLRSAGAVLYFDNSSALPRSITNQVRGRKSDESLTSAISAAEKQKLAVSYIFVSTTQINARCRGRRGVARQPLSTVCRDQVVDVALGRAGDLEAHFRSLLGCRASVLPQVQRVFVWHPSGMTEDG